MLQLELNKFKNTGFVLKAMTYKKCKAVRVNNKRISQITVEM